MNHSLLVVIKKAGEVAIRATGHPALILATGIAVGIATVARTLAKYREGNYGNKQK